MNLKNIFLIFISSTAVHCLHEPSQKRPAHLDITVVRSCDWLVGDRRATRGYPTPRHLLYPRQHLHHYVGIGAPSSRHLYHPCCPAQIQKLVNKLRTCPRTYAGHMDHPNVDSRLKNIIKPCQLSLAYG